MPENAGQAVHKKESTKARLSAPAPVALGLRLARRRGDVEVYLAFESVDRFYLHAHPVAGAVATPELSPFQRTPSESIGVTTSPDEFLMSEENFVAFSSLVPLYRR